MEHTNLNSLAQVEINGEDLPKELLLSDNGRYTTYYAPFEFVNESAKVVICGITPGIQQATVAIKAAKEGIEQGLSDTEVLRHAKHSASFAGAMRRNLAEMMDFISLQHWLGIDSCGDLFQTRQDLVHFTSALRNPVLDQGQNFSGGGAMISNRYLWDQIQDGLVAEIKSLPEDCIFIPLGQGVDAVFEKLASEGVVERKRVLSGLPHASGANAERIAYFCQRKERDQLSDRTNADKLDAAREGLLAQIALLSGKQSVSTGKKLQKAQGALKMPAARVAVANDEFATASHGEVKRIYATGKVKGEPTLFTAKHDRSGRYVLNRKKSSPTTGNTTNRAENKVYTATLREAAELLESGEFLINVVTENGVRALRSYRSVVVERVQ
ncbi:hypothetical protein SAMN05216203_3024 [Marinobacter daqiaonensis]|uniref:Uncharacterized protein n=1 Tax=Marinobacter daqiaonensis TaxID=650891 RepID=A0A1I6JHD0_9GAMM|nr:hypothetical protein [Marinobacter daqiaonensis]SFR78381.1 hypothetical protein SAMN05216203_3024 [Marinobacter daqiaonensis]